jgi:hypothetical protein
MWFSEYQKRVSPEFLERHGLISDAHNMTGSQRATLSLVGGMTAGIFSVFGNNRKFPAVSGALLGRFANRCVSCGAGFACTVQRLTW